ncbi:T9SS C-terminal target domain-containing protein [Fibrisoma montanum]|uniref:T9SS C-terminal target domain-containing protein n=1 Tax=Fibrisoma montanum TaxID=2305895 RepID=A0A418MEB7_9BACT|nr:PQQ-dependent sugar dehydrogenase [Fibrisoma montanum]RIV25077.1 T9SS C-terminal target domain-containing protein [Fibrisoma montanum]
MENNYNVRKGLFSAKLRHAALCVLSQLLLLWVSTNRAQAQTYPANFSQVLVASGINQPTVVVPAPDGRMFVAEQTGALRVIKNGTLLPTPFLQLTVNSEGERGLLGIAFDPNFASNQYLYLYYTTSVGTIHNRVSRFTAQANGDQVVPGSETVLLDMERLEAANHNGGGIAFGADGKLYICVGENSKPDSAQTLTNHLGKVLRINSDGSIPADNPFANAPLDVTRRIWAYGLRNPYNIAVQPGTGRIFVNDVGQDSWEEINDATVGGRNFGWPLAEGPSANQNFVNPVHAYPHSNNVEIGCSITGGTFFNPATTNYPAVYIGKYFYQDFCRPFINLIDVAGDQSAFANSIPPYGVSMATGPDGNLYFLSRGDGALYKIVYTGPNEPEPPTDFAITGVTLNSCNEVSPGLRALTFTPQYTGQSGRPITFRVVNESLPTTNPGPYTINLYTDNPSIQLRARQDGVPGEVGFTYNWLAACNGSEPGPGNVAPVVATSIGAQSGQVGQPFSFILPANTFSDPNGDALTLSVTGLPAGLNFVSPNTISGTPGAPGVSTVTVTATDPGSLSVSTQFTLTVNPGSTNPPSGFAITGVTLNGCESLSAGERRLTFTPQYSGLNGQPVSFSVVNEMLPTTSPGPYSIRLYTDNPTIVLKAQQAGSPGEASFSYNWLSGCAGGARRMAERAETLSVRVLGNPVSSETVDVEVRGVAGQRVQVKALDSRGQVVGQASVHQVGTVERVTVPLGRPAGMYLLRVNTSTEQRTLKVLKN